MDNQHRLIKGYRELSKTEITMMNKIKERGEQLASLVVALEQLPDVDKEWLSAGRIDLQKGIMGLVRAVARPESF